MRQVVALRKIGNNDEFEMIPLESNQGEKVDKGDRTKLERIFVAGT